MIDDDLNKLRQELQNAFAELIVWFDAADELANHRSQSSGWSIREILEHVSLTNHFLLVLIRKGTEKALQKSRTANLSKATMDYQINWQALRRIGEHGSFEWNRPEHMEPTGKVPAVEIKTRLNEQLTECLGHLRRMPNGEGTMYKTTMTVDGLGKIDVYHYLYFLSQHIRRHIGQIKKIASEFGSVTQQNNDHGKHTQNT